MSWQTKIVKLLLPVLFSGWSQGSVDEQRARQEKRTRIARLRAGIRFQPASANGVPAEWIKASNADEGVILYLHGGAYSLGSIDTHREFIARLADITKMRCLAINYRLAPEFPFPAALEDACTAYRWLINQGFDAQQIVIAGDSAGGGLAIATLVALRDNGEPLPAGAICISPWTDLALTGASMLTKARADHILDPESLAICAKYYAGEDDVSSALISPLNADLKGLPPLLIQVGSDEILLDDAIRIAEKARETKVNTTLEIWDDMFHVFQLISFLPETQRAIGRIAEFATGILKLEK